MSLKRPATSSYPLIPSSSSSSSSSSASSSSNVITNFVDILSKCKRTRYIRKGKFTYNGATHLFDSTRQYYDNHATKKNTTENYYRGNFHSYLHYYGKKKNQETMEYADLFGELREEGLPRKILLFMGPQEHVRMKGLSKRWQHRVINLDLEILDMSSMFIPNTKFAASIPSIMKCYRSVKTLNVSNQPNATDQQIISLLTRFWNNLENIKMNDCPQLSDTSLGVIFASVSMTLKSISAEGCKRIRGRLPIAGDGLSNLKIVSFYDTMISMSFVKRLEAKFKELEVLNIIHTPAHHAFFSNEQWNDLLVDLAGFASSGNSTLRKLNKIIKKYEQRFQTLPINQKGALYNTFKDQGKQVIIDVPLDEDDLSTALMLACEDGHENTCKLLLHEGKASIEATDKDGASALFIAGGFGSLSAVKVLIDYGADIERSTICRATPLYIASEMGHESIVKVLLDHGANCNAALEGGATALYVASQNGCAPVVKTLLYRGASLKSAIYNEATALFMACQNGHEEIVRMLLDSGACVDERLVDGATALYVASQRGHKTIVAMLLEHGACANIQVENTARPLYIACQEGNFEVAEMLLKRGADIHATMQDGATALHIAARMGYKDITETLLNHNADINSRTACGTTPLFIASQEGHLEVVEILIARGANLESIIYDGTTPLYIASQNGQGHVVEMLLRHGALPEKAKRNGATALHIASQMGHYQVVQILLDWGATIVVTTNDGISPLYLANQNGHKKLFQMLLTKWVGTLKLEYQKNRLLLQDSNPSTTTTIF